jgi:phage/plasmid-like protein (TIGR03299 family)
MTTPNYTSQETEALGGRRILPAIGTPERDGIPDWDVNEYATPEASKIEVREDGTAAFFSSRQSAWHQLGTTVPEEVTAEEAIQLGGLGWTVTKQPLQTVVTLEPEITADGVSPARHEVVDVPGKFATVRVNPVTSKVDVLGTVGDKYTIVQNIETAQELNAIAQVTGAHFSTAGSLDNGRRMFVSMLLPEAVKIGGQDQVDMFLVGTNSHDGTSSFTAMVTPIRPVCTNTLRLGRQQAVSQVNIRHTKNVKAAIVAARDVLRVTNAFMEEFAGIGNHLIEEKMDRSEFGAFIDKVFVPTVETTGTKKGQETAGTVRRREDLFGLWVSDTQANIAGTRWAAYNAVVEYADWLSPISSRAADTARAERIAKGGLDDVKTRALAMLV